MFLHAALENTAQTSPAAEALVSADGCCFSYAEFCALARQTARQLAGMGIRANMRVGIYLPKHLLSAVAPFAVSMLGAVFVPINPLLTNRQVEHIAKDCDLSILITSPDRAKRLIAELEELRVGLLLTSVPGEEPPSVVPTEVWRFDFLTSRGEGPLSRSGEEADTKLAALLYTSGSTGLPKGVMVSHRNLTLGAQSVNEYLGIDSSDRILALLPFSFDYGLNQLISSVVAGATCILFDYLFPKDVMKAITKHSVTGIAGVPALWTQLADFNWPSGVAEKIRYITNSGGHLPESVVLKLQKIFTAAEPFLMYGLTEAFRSTYLPPSEIPNRPDSIGIPIPNATILVINSAGRLAEPLEEGELVHCGPLVTLGYWNRPQDTAKVFRPLPPSIERTLSPSQANGLAVWSGDTVKRDEQGYLYFIGRRDAMIKTSGYRVSSEELEEIFYAIDEVQFAAVVGVPDERLGQAIIAFVVLKTCAQQHDVDAMMAMLKTRARENLPTYLVPQQIILREELPKNPNGKIDRVSLVRHYEQNS